ncbi:MAG: PAS domain-containing protein, partial [Acidobacteria bacterium]|nr:PAS domain-containing protein [Acidobacteriota bacterium]
MAVLDRLGIHLAVLDRTCHIRWASRALVESRGTSLIGTHCHEGLWRREMDCRACAIDKVIETGEPHRFWVPATRPGALGPRHLVHQVRLKTGDVLETIIDTGAPEQFFPDLVFRERILLQGLRHVPVGVLLLDAAMRVVAANPAVLEMLHVGEEAIKGRTIDELLPAGSFPARGLALAELLTKHAVIGDREVLLGRGTHRRVVLASLAAVLGRNHTFAAAVAILTDITRERGLNEALSRKVGELSLLQEISQVLSRTVRLEQVLRVLLAAVVHPGGLGLGTAALFIVEEREGELRGRLARLRPAELRLPTREVLGLELEALAFGPTTAADRVLENLVKRFRVPLEREGHPLVAALRAPSPCLLVAGSDSDVEEPRLSSLVGPGPVFLAGLQNQGRRQGVLLGACGPGDPRSIRIASRWMPTLDRKMQPQLGMGVGGIGEQAISAR